MKKILCTIICLSITTLFMGCKASAVFQEPSPLDLAETLIQDYVSALVERNYEDIRQLASIPNSDFITDAAIESYLIEKGADQLMGKDLDIESIEIAPSGRMRDFTVTFILEEDSFTFSDTIALKDNSWYLPLSGLYLETWQFIVPPNIQIQANGLDVSSYEIHKKGTYEIPYVAPEPITITAHPTGAIPIELSVAPSGLEATNSLFTVYAENDYSKKASTWYIDALNTIMRKGSRGEDISTIIPYFDMTSYDENGIQNLYKVIQEEHKDLDVQITQYEIYTNDEKNILQPLIINDNGDISMTHLLSYNWIDQFGFSKSMYLITDVVLTSNSGEYKIAKLGESGKALTWVNHFSDDR